MIAVMFIHLIHVDLLQVDLSRTKDFSESLQYTKEKNHYYKRELYTISNLTSSQMR